MKTINKQIVELSEVIEKMGWYWYKLNYETYPLGVTPPKESLEGITIRRLEKALAINNARLTKLIRLQKSGFIW